MILQLLINGIISGSIIALVALGFALVYNTTRIFHIAYAISTTSTNLVVEMVNLLSFAQAASYGIGAYITTLVLMALGLPLLPPILFVMLITAFFGFLIGFATLRLKGDYFVLATPGFQIIIYTVLYKWINELKYPHVQK